MIGLLEEALEAGALGLSSGSVHAARLLYAQPDEIIAFAACSSATTPRYFTHLRDESNNVLDAIAGGDRRRREQCGVHVEIVHFKCSGTDNWGKAARRWR